MNMAAWDLTPEKERQADQIETFVVFCEDEMCEPYYLKSFEKSGRVKINIADRNSSSPKKVPSMLAYCHELGLLSLDGQGGYSLGSQPGVHIWAVFDRDVETLDPAEATLSKSVTFTANIREAEKCGIKVAWSNDVFEIWILLHFEALKPGQWKHRSEIYQRLTNIFKELPDQPQRMMELTGRHDFQYEKFMKTRKNFVPYVLAQLTGEARKLAFKRAVDLEKAFDNTTVLHERNPCTMIHHLVSNILRYVEE